MDKKIITYGFSSQELLSLARLATYVNNTNNYGNDLQKLHRFISIAKDGLGITVTPAIGGAIFKKINS